MPALSSSVASSEPAFDASAFYRLSSPNDADEIMKIAPTFNRCFVSSDHRDVLVRDRRWCSKGHRSERGEDDEEST